MRTQDEETARYLREAQASREPSRIHGYGRPLRLQALRGRGSL